MKKFSLTTKVSSHHTSQTKRIRTALFFGVVAVLLFFAVPKAVAGVSAFILIPVHKIETWFLESTTAFPQYLRDRTALIEQLNAFLYTQSAQSGDHLTSLILSKENVQLRALLHSPSDTSRILAGVIGRPNTVPYDVLILDKGSSDGIKEGAPVFIGNNAIIGVVQKVFAKSSVVILVTTPGFKASVYVVGPNIYTNAEGIGGGLLKIGVPQGISLAIDDVVILPGAQAGIYGEINHIESAPSNPEQYAFVSPAVPIASLRLVSVGENPLLPVSFEQAQKIVHELTASPLIVAIPEGVLVTTKKVSTTSTSTLFNTL